jgi:hypothetical protein
MIIFAAATAYERDDTGHDWLKPMSTHFQRCRQQYAHGPDRAIFKLRVLAPIRSWATAKAFEGMTVVSV